MRFSRLKICLMFGIAIVAVFLFGIMGGGVYAEENIKTELKRNEKGCYYITYTVAGESGKTNSICFDENGWMTSEGAPDVKSFDNDKFSVVLVARNPDSLAGDINSSIVTYQNDPVPDTRVLDVFPGSEERVECDSNKLIPCPSNVGGFAVDESGGAIAVAINYNDRGWESPGVSGYQKFSASKNENNTKERDAGFEELAKMLDDQFLGERGVELRKNNVDVDPSTVKTHGIGERSDEDLPETYADEKDECYAGSGKIGWLICPIINGVAGLGNWLWEEIEVNFLQIKPGEIFRNGSGVNEAWKIFRDIANTIFIIFFLFVIFSQLTGVGIDNYGIKKILPKLIVVAILINLSFLLCAFAVDLSNILGVGLNNMFSSMANLVTVPVQNYTPGQPLVSFGLGAAGAGAGLTLFALFANPVGAISFLTIAAAIGLTVLGIVISLVISILFMYLVLMVRYAGIVILIAVAPVAIVCYMLPNTEQIWKKWLNLLKSLLMVYPICGALIGAGRLAGHILASTGTTSMVIAGMIVEVVPFFLVPMLLKQSLALAGNIGAKLMSMGKSTGRGLSKTARGAATSSPRFKDFSKLEQARSEANRAKRIQDKLEAKKAANGGKLSERDNERLLKATETMNAYQQRKAQGVKGAYVLDAPTAERRAEAAKNAQEQKAAMEEFAGMSNDALLATSTSAASWYDAKDSGSQQRMAALVQAMGSRGMEENVFNMLRSMPKGNDVSNSTAVMQALAGSNNYMMQAYGKKGGGQSFTDFETGGGLQSYISENGISNADKYTLEEINNHADPSVVPQEMAMDGALSAQTPEARNQMNTMLGNKIENMSNVSELASLNLKSEGFAKMHDDTAQAMLESTAELIKKTSTMSLTHDQALMHARNVLHSTFSNQITGAKTNNQISSKVSSTVGPDGVRGVFGF